ncbi:MAG TPA: hypothetical protein VNO32_63705 [Candidatus Acidoferrum sp.]|nr:hypothetical protein [Candidatus Acidoferrum sp.]
MKRHTLAQQDVARSAAPPYQVILPNAADPQGIGVVQSYNVAQYAPMSRDLLDAKINQYPSATNFVLLRTAPLTDDQRKARRRGSGHFQEERHVTGKTGYLKVLVALTPNIALMIRTPRVWDKSQACNAQLGSCYQKRNLPSIVRS